MTFNAPYLRRLSRIAQPVFALVAVVVIAGCTRAPTTERTPKSSTSSTHSAKPAAFSIVAEFSAKDTVAAENDRRILRWAESPCGMSPVVKTASMLIDDAVLQPDFVVEFAPDGRVLRTWGKPYNAPIGVLHGDRISFVQWEDDKERLYWTDTSGRIAAGDSAANARPRIDESAPVDCPSLELFGDSGYLQCFEAIDTSTGHAHRIAFEATCT